MDFSLTLDQYRKALQYGWDSLKNSMTLGLISAVIGGLLGMVIAYITAKRNYYGKRFIEVSSVLMFAVPGTVLGISYILGFNSKPLALTGTGLILVIVFTFRNMPVAIESGTTTLLQIDNSIEEASTILGAAPGYSFRRITLPLLKKTPSFPGSSIPSPRPLPPSARSFSWSLPGGSWSPATSTPCSTWPNTVRRPPCHHDGRDSTGVIGLFNTVINFLLAPRSKVPQAKSKTEESKMSQEKNEKLGFSKKSSGVVLKDVTKIFQQPDGGKDFVAVDHINLEIKDGEMVTLLGPSGCGKTTTLRMISGFEYPTSGNVFFGDRDVAKIPPNKRGSSMVFQSYALFPHLNIWENIAYGLRVAKIPQDEIIRRTNDVVELMQLKGMEKRFPNQLSGGQQQRVALARAVVIEPSVLLFDEPLSNLDAKLRESMRDELRALQQRLGITSLYVTHDQSEAMAISDKVVIMKDGVICQQGTPQEIYEQPASRFVANFIGKANFIDGIFKGRDGEAALVEIGGKTFSIPAPGKMEGVEVGGACCLTVRPESFLLTKDAGALPGTVSRATYYGAKIEYEVMLNEQPIIVEVYNPQLTERFSVGDTVTMSLIEGCVRVLK